MDLDAIRNSPIGELVAISGTDATSGRYEYYAYLPRSLPTDPDLSAQSWAAVAEATGALGQLRQACYQLPNPQLLIAPSLAREAQSTSALEGTHAALPEVLEARLSETKPGSAEVAEIRAYEHIASRAFDWVKTHTITLALLTDLQGKLVEDSREPVRDPGIVREHQVYIGPQGASIEQARFVPTPPGDQLVSGLEAWQDWVNDAHGLPAVLAAALAHYQFETLHPFGNGNGRIGRLVMILQLLRSGDLPEPALTISPWLLRRRTEYQEHLLRVSQTGDWDPWVQFICQGITVQAKANVRVTADIVQWLDEVREMINARRWSGTILKLAQDLVDWPIVTMSFTAKKYGVSSPTAKSAIDRLVEIGVLKELTGRSYRRVFGAMKVIDLVSTL